MSALRERLHNWIDAEAARLHRSLDEIMDREAAHSVNVVDRREWGAEFGRGGTTSGDKRLVVIHHFAVPHVPAGASPEDEVEAIRGVERFHATERGWSGIGYNFVVCQSGRVYEGRGWGFVGAHTQGYNTASIGVAFAMDANEHEPTRAALAACRGLLNEGVRGGHLAPAFSVRGHRDYGQTTCPGDRLYEKLDVLRP